MTMAATEKVAVTDGIDEQRNETVCTKLPTSFVDNFVCNCVLKFQAIEYKRFILIVYKSGTSTKVVVRQ